MVLHKDEGIESLFNSLEQKPNSIGDKVKSTKNFISSEKKVDYSDLTKFSCDELFDYLETTLYNCKKTPEVSKEMKRIHSYLRNKFGEPFK